MVRVRLQFFAEAIDMRVEVIWLFVSAIVDALESNLAVALPEARVLI
jgi:hypothetical protein